MHQNAPKIITIIIKKHHINQKTSRTLVDAAIDVSHVILFTGNLGELLPRGRKLDTVTAPRRIKLYKPQTRLGLFLDIVIAELDDHLRIARKGREIDQGRIRGGFYDDGVWDGCLGLDDGLDAGGDHVSRAHFIDVADGLAGMKDAQGREAADAERRAEVFAFGAVK